MIPYGKQDISDADIQAVAKALKSDFLTQGPKIEEFENKFADYCGVKYAVAVSSCTAALHLSYMVLGMGEGNRVWTSPNTFVATSNAALYCGASVDFVDIAKETGSVCVNALRAKLEKAQESNTLPDIVAPVHFSGASCDMEAIFHLSQNYGFKVVEDAAHCVGAAYKGAKVGNCAFSDIACFSLHPVKIITTAEGGIITTNDEALYKKLLMLRTHGITKDPSQLHQQDGNEWYFEQQYLGYHYRITDIQCALGISQMDRLDDFVSRRQALAKRYDEKLAHLPIDRPVWKHDVFSSWHLYVVTLASKFDRAVIFKALRDKGIGVNVHYIPVYKHPYYQNIGFNPVGNDYPETEDYYRSALTLPLYPNLTLKEQDYICSTLEELLMAG